MTGGITISAKTINGNLQISIKDTGIGIKKEDLPKLFTEFCCLAEHQNINPNGTGLGLYLSRKFAKLMNGSITVKSVYMKGTEFILEFPLNREKLLQKSDNVATEDN